MNRVGVMESHYSVWPQIIFAIFGKLSGIQGGGVNWRINNKKSTAPKVPKKGFSWNSYYCCVVSVPFGSGWNRHLVTSPPPPLRCGAPSSLGGRVQCTVFFIKIWIFFGEILGFFR